MAITHYPECDTHKGGDCNCAEIESEKIQQASLPSPADLIRQAKKQGLLDNLVSPYA